MKKQATYKLFRYLRKALAWLILLMLLLHAIAAFLLSNIDYFKSNVENTLSGYLNAKVGITQISGSLIFFNPEIQITHFTLKDQSLHTSQHIQSITLRLNLIASLKARSVILTQVIINHAQLNLTKTQSGWHIKGVPKNTAKTALTPILNRIIKINYIKVEHTHIGIFDKKNNTKNTLSIQNLTTWKINHKTFIESELLLNHSPARVDASFKTSNSLSGLTNISAYISSDALALSPWASIFMSSDQTNLLINKLIVNTKAWIQWQPNHWSITSQFSTPEAQLTMDHKPLTIKQLNGEFSAKGKSVRQWSAKLHTSGFSINSHPYPEFSALAEYNSLDMKKDLTVTIPSINIDALKRVALGSRFLPHYYQELLEDLDPQGVLNDTAITFHPSQKPFDFKATTTVHNLSVNAWNGAPSGKNISGHVTMNAHHGTIDVNSKNASLELPELFNQAWHFNTIKGKFYWELTPDTYTLYTPDTTATSTPTHDLNLTTTWHTMLKLGIPLNNKKPVHMTLKTGLDHLPTSDVSQYLPVKILSKTLGKWIEKSLPKGTVSNGTFEWNGPLENDQSENFTWGVNLDLKNGQFHYSPDWPDIDNVNATLHINQKGLCAKNVSGVLYNSPIHHINATLENFEHPTLQLSADGKLKGKDVLHLFKNTPINKILKNAPDNWNILGELDTHLQLSLPLTGKNTHPDIRVQTKTKNGQFSIPSQHIDLQAIDGDIHYSTKHGLEAKHVKAQFLNHPATLSIDNELLRGKENMTSIRLQSHANFDDMKAFIPKSFYHLAKGDFDYRVQIGIPEKAPYFVDIQSDLKGLSLDLPKPFHKTSDTSSDFHLMITPKNQQLLEVVVKYGQKIHTELNIKNNKLLSGYIAFNTPDYSTKLLHKSGLSLLGTLEEVNITHWKQWYEKYKPYLASTKKLKNSPPIFAHNLRMDTLSYNKHELSNVILNGHINHTDMFASFHSDQVSGTVEKKVDHPFNIMIDTLKLPERLKNIAKNLSHDHSDKTQRDALSQVDPTLFPAMQVNVKNLLIGNTPYGYIKFHLVKQPNGLTLDNLNASLGELDINGVLGWKKDKTSTITDFKGTLKTNDLNQVAKNWNYTNKNFNAKEVKIKINESWPGSPAGFNFDHSEGWARIELRNGNISAAKGADPLHIFGLLNIDAITRRLRLNFSDLYDTGVSFDKITGDITFSQGLINLDTPLIIDGPSSNFTIKGAINLPDKFMDLDMIVTLPVTQNLPIIGVLLGQPVIAGAIYLFDKIVGKSLMRFTSVRYDIVGPISHPDITLDKLFADKLKKRPHKPESKTQ